MNEHITITADGAIVERIEHYTFPYTHVIIFLKPL